MTNTKIIELTADLTNPSPDRRSKDWHKQVKLKAGDRFIIWDGVNGVSMHSSAHQYGHIYGNEPLAKLILANSKPVEPQSVRELSEVHGCAYGGEEILRIMLKLGRINAADFEAVGKVSAEDENF